LLENGNVVRNALNEVQSLGGPEFLISAIKIGLDFTGYVR